MLFKFPKQKTTNEIFQYVQDGFVRKWFNWIIDSKYRKSVQLQDWIKEQVDNPSKRVVEFSNLIDTLEDYDEQVLAILRFVRNYLTYKTDSSVWNMLEKWQTADESLQLGTGDCEDGAILMYVIARLKGIPSNRLLLMCGDVKGGGHCWLAYRPNEYPLNWVFLDWCYWVNLLSVESRNKFYIKNKIIYEYKPDGLLVKSNYYNIWFGFNEELSVLDINYYV